MDPMDERPPNSIPMDASEALQKSAGNSVNGFIRQIELLASLASAVDCSAERGQYTCIIASVGYNYCDLEFMQKVAEKKGYHTELTRAGGLLVGWQMAKPK